MAEKLTINICIELAKSKNGECLSLEYINCYTKMLWRCENQHIWPATYNTIQQGHWCSICCHATNSIEDCVALAKSKGGLCLSTDYVNAHAKLQWRCVNNHTWWSNFNHIRIGTWCPKCSKKFPHTIDDCIKFAKNKNGRCLSEQYKNAKTKLQWQCSKEHIWWACFDNIKNGNKWCPKCMMRKEQSALTLIAELIFGTKSVMNYRGFDWLKLKTNKQEIDIWFPELKLAIEYDGEQHFYPIEYFGGQENFEKTTQRDHLKNQKIAEHTEDIKYFIRFNYKEPITKEYVIQKLIDCSVPIPNIESANIKQED